MKFLISIFLVLFTIIGFGVTTDLARAANPCSVNPCTVKANMTSKPIRRARMKSIDDIKGYSEDLWSDAGLGKSGLSCNSCHPNGKGLKRGTWPKYIKMPRDVLTLDQMINFCMMNPMKAKPLKWNLQKMTGLAYYVSTHSKELEEGEAEAVNPCAVNPCAVNPCAVNPCATNPCATNPCAVNPCATNPCAVNPCATNPCAVNPCATNPCATNPCAVNPCAVNPCAVNPCAVNPCAVNPCAVNPCATNPCAVNPCAANPCAGN